MDSVREALVEELGEDGISELAARYADAYEGCYDAEELDAYIEEICADAYAQFNSGENSIFYVTKKAATLAGEGVQFPSILQAAATSSDGIVRKIDSKINMSIENVTQSQQLSAGLAIGRTSRRRRASKSRSKTAAKRLMRWIWLRGHLFLRI